MPPSGLPPVALTCGEPSGVGPEIAVKAWEALGLELPFFWIGDPEHLPEAAKVAVIQDPAETRAAAARGLPVLPNPFARPATPGRPSHENAPGVVEVIDRAVRLVDEGKASAVCTSPISKKVLADWAGFAHPGHTEYLAHLGGVDDVAMMLAAEELRVVPATIHIPLSRVPEALTPEKLESAIRITRHALQADFGIEAPRIAVAGLNPHAGEDGMLGREEMDWIKPLCDMLRGEGMDLTGPLPADTMFHERARAGYDAAVAMYHDQALIPIKTLAFDRGVNVTLGLPFIRTSPDHGTAFDIAGTGQADPTSLIEALRLADAMARTRAGI